LYIIFICCGNVVSWVFFSIANVAFETPFSSAVDPSQEPWTKLTDGNTSTCQTFNDSLEGEIYLPSPKTLKSTKLIFKGAYPCFIFKEIYLEVAVLILSLE
jgi:hypothetical protein